MKKIALIFICIISTNQFFFAQTKEAVVTNVSSEKFKEIIEKDKKGVIIDLRTPDEISKGFIKGAIEIDFLAKDAEAKIDKLDKSKTYYVYCAGGGRSGDAAEMMEKKGFKKVYNLEKGFFNWKQKGYLIEKK